MKNKILVIDGTYLAYRSYFATTYKGVVMANQEGTLTNAVFGFFNTLLTLIKMQKVTHVFVAFDSKIKTFRHELFSGYKATRQKAPSDFYVQLNFIQQILDALNITNFYKDGFEADDIIAKVVSIFSEDEILIHSADQDLNQLINPNVAIIKKNNKGVYFELNANNFGEYYDFLPSQVIDYKALVGDSSDNFKGVPGIGPKSAAGLLHEYGTLENIFANIESIKPALKAKIEANKEEALRDKYLATLRTDFEIPPISHEELLISAITLSPDASYIIRRLELNSLKNRLLELLAN
ncbi:5'-3' exonuclease, exo domain of DNA polymerase I [Metamycoplasma arthritidis]|uniref:5'-3' exonuclease n=1 Tax=Metamycoplasma arthritidis TaxID=2111 RepID=UPI001004EF42|nr:5'-3' exonuclease H3TH domain-containing protein [Metamycoplasma arthritidis]VEU78922.1 5'-3' exonuclease, exo domain of DNA polymerase I [Metamycoplasma arthritidis]